MIMFLMMIVVYVDGVGVDDDIIDGDVVNDVIHINGVDISQKRTRICSTDGATSNRTAMTPTWPTRRQTPHWARNLSNGGAGRMLPPCDRICTITLNLTLALLNIQTLNSLSIHDASPYV